MSERAPGWWYPYAMFSGIGVAVVVNLTLAYFATTTFTGLAVDKAYEKGLKYNNNIEAARTQADLQWNVTTEYKAGSAPHQGSVLVTYVDKNGKGVEGLEVQALIKRPNLASSDMRVSFSHQGNGIYQANPAFPEPGQWDFDVLAIGRDVTYQMQRRLVVP